MDLRFQSPIAVFSERHLVTKPREILTVVYSNVLDMNTCMSALRVYIA